MAILDRDGRPFSVRTDEENLELLLQDIERLPPDEQLAFREVYDSIISGDTKPYETLSFMDFDTPPVDIKTFLTDPYFLGETGGSLYPRLKDDLIELFQGNYTEAILGGSITTDSIVVSSDGSLKTLGERIGQTRDVLVTKDNGCIVSSSAGVSVTSGIKPVKRLVLANVMSLCLTSDHGVRVWREDKYQWCEAGQLQKDDLVVVVRKYKTTPTSFLSKDEAMLIAYWAGDGSVSEQRARFCDGNPETSKEVVEILNRLGFVGVRGPKDNAWEVYVSKNKTSGFYDWSLSHNLELDSCNVIVSDEVCRSSNEIVASFLNRLWACEGTVYASLESDSPPRFQIGMTSERFIRQVQFLLFRFGIQSRIQRTPQTDKRRDKVSISWQLSVSGVDNLFLFLSEIGYILGKEDACKRI